MSAGLDLWVFISQARFTLSDSEVFSCWPLTTTAVIPGAGSFGQLVALELGEAAITVSIAGP